MRVLVVEDERWIRETMRSSLLEAGFEVDLAETKKEGLRLGRQGGIRRGDCRSGIGRFARRAEQGP